MQHFEIKRIPSCDFWAYEKGQSARIYRSGFIEKNDHVIPWNKDLLLQVSWLEKKLVTFPLFNFCLYQQKWFLDCETYIDQTRWRRYITSFSRSTFDVNLNHLPYVKSRFKKDSLLILPYSDLLWYNWEEGWVKG